MEDACEVALQLQNCINMVFVKFFVATTLKLVESVFVTNFKVPMGIDVNDAPNVDRMDRRIEPTRL